MGQFNKSEIQLDKSNISTIQLAILSCLDVFFSCPAIAFLSTTFVMITNFLLSF